MTRRIGEHAATPAAGAMEGMRSAKSRDYFFLELWSIPDFHVLATGFSSQ